MTKKLDLPLILLSIAGFLAPLLGGQISLDVLPLDADQNPLYTAFAGSPETPILSHTILGGLCAAALIVLLLQRKILQVPNNVVGGLVLGLMGLIVGSVGLSSYRYASIPSALEWLTYGCSFYAVVAGAGRRNGPAMIIGSIFAGCVVLSMLGILEYSSMKAVDPTWRIMTHWTGSNAMAAILVVGFFLGITLMGFTERLATAGVGVGCFVIGLAIFLAQSKGALLSFGVGFIVLFVLMAVWIGRRKTARAFASTAVVVVLICTMALAISKQAATKASAGPAAGEGSKSAITRLVNAGGTADQSVEFRKLLWKSAADLIKENPVGSGLNTFQFESAKPGLVTQTKMAHESYLQLGLEASVVAPLLLVAMIIWWAWLLCKAGTNLTEQQKLMRAGVSAAVAVIVVHNLFDSDLYYDGIGLVLFMLMGLGLLLSTDAVAPEFIPSVLRRVSIAGLACLVLFLGFTGVTEALRAEARGEFRVGNVNGAMSALESVRSMAPWDASAWDMSVRTARTPTDALAYATKAAELAPDTHNLRTLAYIQNQIGKTSDALLTLKSALRLDPNNLAALTLMADFQVHADMTEDAKATLHKIVNVEQKPYFKVRSLTELVPTDTFAARIKLASMSRDPREIVNLLKPAVDGFKQYASLTLQNVIRFANDKSGGIDFAGETPQVAKTKLEEAKGAATQLASAYRAEGDAKLAEEADADAAAFDKDAASISFK